MTSARSFVRNAIIVRNSDGSALLVEAALVSLFEHGTFTSIDIYDTETGGAPLAQPIRSDATGKISFWADLGSAPLFDAFVSSDGSTVRAGTVRPVSFDSFTEVLPSPSLAGQGAAGPVSMASAPLLALLGHGVESGVVLVAGDSTSDAGSGAALGNATRWPAQWAPLIAADWPGYTVTFQQWQDATGSPVPFSYPAPTVVQTGPGGLTDHAAAAGSAASATILDPAATAGMIGKRVIGTNIPPRSCVGSPVVEGVSWTLVDSPNATGVVTYPWGTVAGVKIGADPVLHIYDGSVAATRWLYGFGTHLDAQYTRTHPDLVIANHGHNEPHVAGAFAPLNCNDIFVSNYLDGLGMLEQACPGAPIMVTAQNPRTDAAGAADVPIKARLIAAIAAARGCELIDVYQTFLDYGTGWAAALLAVDGIHPSPAGSALWAQEVQALHFTLPANRRAVPRASLPAIFQTAAPEQLAPGFIDFLAAGQMPPGWLATNATVVVDTLGGITAAKVVSTAASGRVDIPLDLAKCAGQMITATARVQYAQTNPAVDCGAIAIRWTDLAGTKHTELSTFGSGNAVGAWYYQSIRKAIPSTATDVRVWLYGDVAGGTDPTWYRSLTVHRGPYPAGPVPSQSTTPLVPKAITDALVSPTAAIRPTKIAGLGQIMECLGPILPGVAGVYFDTPSATANRVTGQIELIARLGAGTSCRPASPEAIGAKWGAAGARSYALQVSSTGAVGIAWSEDGTAAKAANSNAGVLAATLAQDTWVKVTLDPNVAGQYQVKVYTSTDGVTFAQMGTTTNGVTGPTSIFDATTQPVEIGSVGSNTSQFFAGAVLLFTISDTIGVAADQAFEFTDPEATTSVAGTGETWTRHGTPTWDFQILDPLPFPGVVTAAGGLGAGNTAAATTLGTVARKLPLFAADGSTVLGYVPIYDAIT